MAAMELGIPVATPERARAKEFVKEVAAERPDALVVASYGQILSEAMLAAAIRGGINFHASILPAYRGAAPIQRAILAGETLTGVTLMQMDKGMDTGDIIASESLTIGPTETEGELEARLAQLAASMAHEWLARVVAGDYPRRPQDERLTTYAPKMGREDGVIALDMPVEAAYRIYRAATPRPGCTIETRLGSLKVHTCRTESLVGRPGEVLGIERGLTVSLQGGSLTLDRVQSPGKQPLAGNDFAHGKRLTIGDNLL
jgi:methionyl-tRNA formyltransferase